jgi:uncharacterized protein (UPF0335 family)
MQRTTQQPGTELERLERERDQLAQRLQGIASEPDPWMCEGRFFFSSLDCSIERGERIEELLNDIDALNDAIRALIVPSSLRPALVMATMGGG